jgi:uncharacterized membrane protein HdeD (DUF308 family)
MMNAQMDVQLSRYWWLVLLRGVLAIIFGVLAFIWPGVTLVVIIAFFGAYMFLDGVVALVQAVRFRHERDRWPMLLLEGVLGIIVGVVTYFWPGITALAWVFTIAAWAIVTGVLEIVSAVRIRQIVPGEIWFALSGFASIILGLAFAFLPLLGLIAAVWLVGVYAIVYGAFLILLSVRLRGLGRPQPGAPATIMGRTT